MSSETAQQDQIIRDLILQVAKRFPQGMTLLTLETCIRSGLMQKVPTSEVELHLRYLESCKFIEEVPKRTPQWRLWRITADGLDELARRDL
jgi:hypothetical protein